MHILIGSRTATLSFDTIHDRRCDNCNESDISIGVFRDYYHIWYIPFATKGIKTTKILCSNCGKFIRSDSLTKEYESKARTPFYLYSGAILVGLAVLVLVGGIAWESFQSKGYITQPQIGDVYEIRQKEPIEGTYSFVRVMRVDKDSVVLCENNNIYSVSGSTFDKEDYFSADKKMMCSKADLKDMYDKKIIVGVNRDYSDESGFNRIN